jgi:hypothetical protein
LLEGREPSHGSFLELDDLALEHAIASYRSSDDALLAGLAERLRNRHLFKTIRIRADVPTQEVQDRVDRVLADQPDLPDYFGSVDRLELNAYAEKETLMVLSSGRLRRLVDASPVIHGLSNETFVQYRAIFPPEVRDRMQRELEDLT